MLRASTIIEITSSPEPEVNVEARRPAAVSEPGNAAQSTAKGTAKRRPKARQKAQLSPTRAKASQRIMGPVIELTDSDDEERGRAVRVSMPSPQAPRIVIELDDSDADESIQPRTRVQAQTTPRANAVASGSGLGSNIRTSIKRARETSPAGEHPQKRVLRTSGGNVVEVIHADAYDEETEEELEGYDPHFALKPFPFDFLDQRATNGVAGPSRLPPPPPAGRLRQTFAESLIPPGPAADNGIQVITIPQPASVTPHLPLAAHPPWVDHALRRFRNSSPPPAKPDAPNAYMRFDPVAASKEAEITPPAPVPRPSPPLPFDLLPPHIQPADDLAAAAMAQIIDVVPDIDRAHLAQLVAAQLPEHGADTPRHVLAALFDSGVWPREGGGNVGADVQLEERGDIVGWLAGHPGGSGTGRKNKGKRRARDFDEDLENELRPAKRLHFDAAGADRSTAGYSHGVTHSPKITSYDLGGGDSDIGRITSKDKGKGRALPDSDDASGRCGIECQCCFGEYSFDTMVQCPEAHLFCAPCVEAYAGTQLGLQRSALLCMHASGCARPFPAAQLARALPAASLALWERLTQADEIAQAGLTGLAECPFCEWKCVLEEEEEGGASADRFWCGNREKCGVISCRKCKKSDHAPKTCDEAEADKHLDGRHTIEEAMTAALMRNCPKCKKAFIKDEGCNKMTCPTCRTLSCYVCRAVITGYEHFDQTPRGHASTSRMNVGKCRLWDNVEERHADEVRAAAAEATAAYKRAHPDAVEAEIAVEVPVVAAPAVQSARGRMWRGFGGMLGRVLPAMPLRAAAPQHNVFPVLRMLQQPVPMGYGMDARMWGAGPPLPPFQPPPQAQQVQLPVNPFDIALGGHAELMRLQVERRQRAEDYVAQQQAQVAAAPPPPFGFNLFAGLYPGAAPAAVHAPPALAPAIVRRRQDRLPARATPQAMAGAGVPPLLRRSQPRQIILPEPPAAAIPGPAGIGVRADATVQQQRSRKRALVVRRG